MARDIERPACKVPNGMTPDCPRCEDCGMLAVWEEMGGWSWAFCDCQRGKDECEQQHKEMGYGKDEMSIAGTPSV